MDWKLISFVQGRIRRKCLEELNSGQKTPQMIAKSIEEHLSHVSRALRELSEKKLAICLTPDQNKNRFYEITTLGQEILEKVAKLDSPN